MEPQISSQKPEIEAVLAAHHAALATGQGVLKTDRRTALTRVQWGGCLACVKEYRWGGLLAGSRLWRAVRGAKLLAAKGVAAPELLAALCQGRRAYLVTRYVEDATPLKKLFSTRFAGRLSPEELRAKRSLIRQLAAWLRSIHDKGIYHDDWSAKNILAAQRGEDWQFWLLDLESLSARKRLTYRRRVKNLGQLADVPGGLSATDKMRFLLAYAAGDRAFTRGSFPRDVLRYTLRRIQARQRREARRRAGAR